MDLPALPPTMHWSAPAHWRAIDVLSDLHLAAGTPRTFAAFAAHLLNTPADAVVLLGDVFEFWVGDDQRHLPFERQCLDVLTRAARRLHLAFMAGNRDFLAGDALREACGWQVLGDPTVLQAFGRSWLLTHGDELCLADTEYQRFRALSRGDAWQRDFLAQPLSARLAQATAARAASEARKRETGIDPELWADVDPDAAAAWLRATGAATLVHGHTHRPGTETLEPGLDRQVLSDWDLDHGSRAEVLRLSARGLERLPPVSR